MTAYDRACGQCGHSEYWHRPPWWEPTDPELCDFKLNNSGSCECAGWQEPTSSTRSAA